MECTIQTEKEVIGELSRKVNNLEQKISAMLQHFDLYMTSVERSRIYKVCSRNSKENTNICCGVKN